MSSEESLLAGTGGGGQAARIAGCSQPRSTSTEFLGWPQTPLDYRPSIHQDSSMPETPKRARQLPAASMHLVLALLEGENHGYGLMRRVEELSDGAVCMGPGTLYGTLNRL